MSPKVFAIGFYPTDEMSLNAVTDWATVYRCPHNSKGEMGTLECFKTLNIPFKDYDIGLLFTDWPTQTMNYIGEQCEANNVILVGNQHGSDKSVAQAAAIAPNKYHTLWNANSPYWLDRFEEVFRRPAWTQGWMSVGALRFDYIHRKYRWDRNQTNGKVLVIHEPDPSDALEESHWQYKTTPVTQSVIDTLEENEIPYDLKVHPSWANFVGNRGNPMWSPKRKDNLVNISLGEMIQYDIVIASGSTVLLDAACMNIPCIAVKNPSYPVDDYFFHWGAVEGGLYPLCDAHDIHTTVLKIMSEGFTYDQELSDYYLGPLGHVQQRYQSLIEHLVKDRDQAA